MPKSVNSPHDAFIANILRRKPEAISFIKGVVPSVIKQNVKFDSLRLSPETYISKSLRKSFSDIVYEADYYDQTPMKIVFIIEHKSKPPSINVKLQLLDYFMGVVHTQIKQRIRSLTNPRQKRQKVENLAIPIMIVFYHGKEPWIDEPLWRLFGKIADELKKYVPDFEYILCNLNDYNDDKIKELFDSFTLRHPQASQTK